MVMKHVLFPINDILCFLELEPYNNPPTLGSNSCTNQMNIMEYSHINTSFLFLALLFVITIILFKTKKGVINLPPGSFGWPFIGETLEFLDSLRQGSTEKFIKERTEKYSSQVFKTSLLGEPMAVLSGTAGNKFLFSNENKMVTLWWPASVRKLLGKCLTTTGREQGMHMRKTLSYFVSPDAFSKLYIRTMDLVSRQHLDAQWQGKEELKVFPAMKQYTFELACRLFMSIHDPSTIEKLAALFRVFLGGVISIPLDFPGTKFYYAKKATVAIKKELKIIIRQRSKDLEQKTASPSQDLLSHLLVTPDESGKFMSESVIVNNILMLLFAGHDTSSCLLTMLIKVLAQHPQVYEEVLREQNEIVASKDPGEFLQWEDIQKMKYSWNVVCETTRLWPPITGGFREALVDINYEDSSLFRDEKKFDPTRFDNCSAIPYSFVPFGGGPRMCLGKEFARLEILTFLHNLIPRFRWDILIPEERIICDPIPTPEKGLPVRICSHQQ
ncbi:cytochrome P450 [Striga asiatica]|uniref:Cytochrome P450 n=1 Tax=Striga asiatica TaxID=4170 RepID=A0A5A7R326_STRAF|nr:cytochrome P450 [Striga asiatica]